MKLNELKKYLQRQPALNLVIALPDGRQVPPHFHVTEVGHVARKFVDCGGKFRASETCVLQAHVGSPIDDGHRLTAGKLAHILGLAAPVLATDELPVELEYEAGVVAQFSVAEVRVEGNRLILQLGAKHTDCLAKEKCGTTAGSSCGVGASAEPVEAVACCGGRVGAAAGC